MENSITQTIIQTINEIFNILFSSIDNNIYSILDNLTFINKDILSDYGISNLLNYNYSNSFIIIANSILIGFVLYYCVKLILSHYTSTNIEKPYQFIIKTIIFAISINSCYFICEQFININYLISSAICDATESIINHSISFQELANQLEIVINIEENSFSFFSVDGILKSFISFGIINLLLSNALRYIILKVFILISPFSILCLINSSTSWFFKSWFRIFLSLLLLQSLIAIILATIFTISYSSSNEISKFLYVGGIYALARANTYIRSLIGGLSTNITNNIKNKFIK